MSAAANSVSTAATAWHALTADEVQKRLATSTGKGLDTGEASSRLQKHGPNRLPEGKKSGPFKRFLSQLNNILVYVLLGAGFAKLMLGLWVDASIIFGWCYSTRCSGSSRKARRRRRWTRSATCCPPKRGPCAAVRPA